MMTSTIIWTIAVIAILGLVLAVVLYVVAEKFKVEEDPRIEVVVPTAAVAVSRAAMLSLKLLSRLRIWTRISVLSVAMLLCRRWPLSLDTR